MYIRAFYINSIRVNKKEVTAVSAKTNLGLINNPKPRVSSIIQFGIYV